MVGRPGAAGWPLSGGCGLLRGGVGAGRVLGVRSPLWGRSCPTRVEVVTFGQLGASVGSQWSPLFRSLRALWQNACRVHSP